MQAVCKLKCPFSDAPFSHPSLDLPVSLSSFHSCKKKALRMFLLSVQNQEAKQNFFRKLEIWESTTKVCKSKTCPITTPHTEGRYHHNGQRSIRNPTFGSCNPPPQVWAAYHRIKAGNFTTCDKQLVDQFRTHHVFQSHGNFAASKGRKNWFREKRVLSWENNGDAELL